jgi:fido (protein-threonine AMPylation protein)
MSLQIVSQGGPIFLGRYFNDVFEQAGSIRGHPIANGAHHMKRFIALFMACIDLMQGWVLSGQNYILKNIIERNDRFKAVAE